MGIVKDDILMHYGMPKRSGRYPWGSGENAYQRTGDFLSRISELTEKGMSEKDISDYFGLSTKQYRTQKSLANAERRALDVDTARGLQEKGYSLREIANKMGYSNDSSVRSLLNTDSEARMKAARATADHIRSQIDSKGIIDVGAGVELELGISKEKLDQALYMLELEGYPVYGAGVSQVTNKGQQTNIKVICPPGTEHKDVYNFENVHSLKDYISPDQGDTFEPSFVYPKSMDSKRIQIRYAEDGGTDKDGVVEIRRNVDDLSLGDSRYAQVRILVDDSRYIKGMAVYSDNLPDGVDIIFNTNKPKSVAKTDVFKKINDDPDNPFGSLIKEHGGQSYYIDSNGKKQLSLINKRAEEGDWGEWSDKLSSQFLSKQNMALINKQLKLAIDDKVSEYEEIMSLTNPTVKKAMLKSFADDCDSSAVHLYAAALPRQKYQVILPVNSLKDNEVYAPNYKDGEQIALVRYPHGGTFEIPILRVNNKHKQSIDVMGNAKDAIGINSKVAERLSGADFDGDTVMCIPTNAKVKISSSPPLKGLEGFDPKMQYPTRAGMKQMNNTQTEMGKISNLITDMTLKGATQDELARAVRHSMVVIDAEKHKLDYKKSESDNKIAALKKRYQGRIVDGKYKEGASTLISQSKSETTVIKRKGSPIIDPLTGEQTFKENRETYTDPKTGKVKFRTQSSTKMAETRDARTLSSGTPQEEAYATYANKMKSLANQSRKEMLKAGSITYSKTAKETYLDEFNSLSSKLNVALKNAPRERQAQVMANATISAKRKANPDMTKAEIKKESQRALTQARAQLGASRKKISITDREWEAIQAGAISENKLIQIINNVDKDELRQRATPRQTNSLSTAKINKAKAMMNSGYTRAQIAESLGVSASTITKLVS